MSTEQVLMIGSAAFEVYVEHIIQLRP